MDIQAIKHRVQVERERQREVLDWHENRRTWSPPPLPEQERMEREQQIYAGLIPF